MVASHRSTDPGWLQEGIIRSSMLGKTLLPGDEELGKKDDDHRHAPARRAGYTGWKHTFRWRRRRNLLVLVGVVLVYVLFSSTRGDVQGLGDDQRFPLGRPSVPSSSTYEKPVAENDEPTGPPPGIQKPRSGNAVSHTYGGQVRFYRLAKSLRPAASRTSGYEQRNRNIVYAVSGLKSVATLLPMICEMSTWSRNHVHVAFMGREDIPVEDLLEINGIDKAKCPATWHDARPDYMEYSSDTRAELGVQGAMMHINSFLHPQAVIMDDSLTEDMFFIRGIRAKSTALKIPVIEVPKNRVNDFYWITRLDAGSLRNWHTPNVDILIQVPPDSSSVLRLLKSIKEADYSGLKHPRITLELPADLDQSVKQHVEKFIWPPHNDGPDAESGLIIRRRIANIRATQEDAAIRFLELFYPTSTSNSHLLLLSPQAQLSPQYFHFIKYTLLEYKYSTFGEDDNGNLMGVSLELPPTRLDGKTALTPPTLGDMHTGRYQKLYPRTKSAPFLWQAPNSHATLFFGNKWAELHSFLSDRVLKHQKSIKPIARSKLISETLPSWTEYMLEFMRARGYSILYPASASHAFVTVHNELYHVPEEFTTHSPDDKSIAAAAPPDAGEPFLRADTAPRSPSSPEPPIIPITVPLHEALPFNGDLPELPHLPQLLYTSEQTALTEVRTIATAYANDFRAEVGGCTIPKGKHRKIIAGEAGDLFCFGDEDEDDWETDPRADEPKVAQVVSPEQENLARLIEKYGEKEKDTVEVEAGTDSVVSGVVSKVASSIVAEPSA